MLRMAECNALRLDRGHRNLEDSKDKAPEREREEGEEEEEESTFRALLRHGTSNKASGKQKSRAYKLLSSVRTRTCVRQSRRSSSVGFRGDVPFSTVARELYSRVL